METIVRTTRGANFAPAPKFRGPTESVGGRYQHVWSLGQREAWLRGRGERLRILAPQSTQLAANDLRDFLNFIH